jgi:hypothetical protein
MRAGSWCVRSLGTIGSTDRNQRHPAFCTASRGIVMHFRVHRTCVYDVGVRCGRCGPLRTSLFSQIPGRLRIEFGLTLSLQKCCFSPSNNDQ